MTDGQMCCDLKAILSRLLTQIKEHEKGTNRLLPTPPLLLLHVETIALSTLQDYPCTLRTSIQAAIPWYAIRSVYGAARGWRQGDYKADVQDVIVIIKCTIQEAHKGHYPIPRDHQEHNTIHIDFKAQRREPL